MTAGPAIRRHARRATVAMALVVVLAPVALLGGAFTVVLVPCIALAALALRSALAVRRLMHADQAPAPSHPNS